jgi:hypothetical protein
MPTKQADVYVAVTAFAHEGGMVGEGERLTADDPLVETFPKFFSPENDVKQILAKKEALWAGSIETASNHPRPLVQRWQAKRRVRVEADAESRVVEKGDLLSPGDPLLLVCPKSFFRTVGELE